MPFAIPSGHPLARVPLSLLGFLLVLLASVPGCAEDYFGQRERERERRHLEERERNLRVQIDQITAGKSTFSAEEKATLGPLSTQLREVEGQLLSNRQAQSVSSAPSP